MSEQYSFSMGLIVDKQRTVALRYDEDKQSYIVQFQTIGETTDEELEQLQKVTVKSVDGRRVTTLGIYPDTMECLFKLFSMKLLADEGIDPEKVRVKGWDHRL